VTQIALQTVVPLGGPVALTPAELAADIAQRRGKSARRGRTSSVAG